MLLDWEVELIRELDLLSIKHEHALFFRRLVTEWLANFKELSSPDGGADGFEESFEQVEREEMHVQRAV